LNLKNVLYAFYTETISLLISKRDKAFDVATERKYGSSLQLHWTLRADAKKGIYRSGAAYAVLTAQLGAGFRLRLV
jgi:hypothetical protein